MPTVFANGRSILHAGDGLTHTSAVPDVCKTPIPYVNAASDGDLAKGTKRVKIEGKSVALESSHLSTSTGDEAGTAGGGLVSSKTKGKMTWGSASSDVKFEGKGVVRFGDVTQHNGNSFNAAFVAMGGTGLAYADDFDGPCPICRKGPEAHRVLETDLIAEKTGKLVAELHRLFDNAPDDTARARVARLREDGTWSGYMVGVMSCKCDPPQYFCTNSGHTMPGLVDAANAVGGFTDVIMGGGAKQADFVKANKSAASADWKQTRVAKAFKSANRSRLGDPDVEARLRARKSGYSVPGACAGAKLVAKCSHAPRCMCEVFFAPRGQVWSGTYKVRTTSQRAAKVTDRKLKKHADWAQRVLANMEAKELKHTFDPGDSVASCHTCQETLFLTMCPERTCG